MSKSLIGDTKATAFNQGYDSLAAERDEWKARANALLSVLDKAVSIVSAGHTLTTHRGGIAIDRREYEALRTAVEEYRRLSGMEAAVVNRDEAATP